jgi:radical SAM protein with 4Fe4S-binding SPASM domain
MFPNRITFQWHLTDECNYRCKHCYQDNYTSSGVDLIKLKEYYYKLENFVVELINKRQEFKAHINFTGGEPFLKEELLDLLQIVKENGVFSFGILTNGHLLPEDKLLTLNILKPSFIQISLEGNEQVNDSIRGKGSYQEILKAIQTYNKYGIPVMISFTANSENYKLFGEVVRLAQKYKVYKVWTDRYLPKGLNDPLALNTEQVKEFFHIIQLEKKRKISNLFSKTIISSNRALQFLVNGEQPYNCSAGKTLLTILPNGDIFPCRRLPIKIGNLDSDNLYELYRNSNILTDLRSCENLNNYCKECYYSKSCNGGLKCLSYSVSNDFHLKDPNCWI